ncbi:uncharacterized protein [Triticum aestivum]|uniref:uncharacterized protein n=1 Tax=Triticum aestivum TaxID=4565 RepID=UPI001D017D7E|nr:uncharacterized protein LOC123125888 [Triticum aestivum]
MVQPPVGNPGLGHGGFSQPAPTLDSSRPWAIQPSAWAAASLERECTICKGAPTPLLWNAKTAQGTRVGSPLPICWDCYGKILAGGRPLDHLEQYLASTAVGGGGGSIPEFLAAHGHGGGYSQWAANPVTSPLLWCVNCNFLAELLWDNLPMCWPCYDQSLDKMAVYEYQAVDQALAQIRDDKARAHQEVAEALAQGRSILTGPRRQLDHGQSSSAAPPHAQAQGRCHRCGAPEHTRMSQGGFPVCELCFNN